MTSFLLGREVDESPSCDSVRRELCDWAAGELGGYGTTTMCGNQGTQAIVQTPQNQAMCIATAFKFACSVTVGEYEGCIEAQVPSRG